MNNETVLNHFKATIKSADNMNVTMQEEMAKGTSAHIHFIRWNGLNQMRGVIWKGLAEDMLARYERLKANGKEDKFVEVARERALQGLLTAPHNSTNPASNMTQEFEREYFQSLFDNFDGIFEL